MRINYKSCVRQNDIEILFRYISYLVIGHVFHILEWKTIMMFHWEKELFAYNLGSQGFRNTYQTCTYYL